jgi:TPR repeat protein
MALANGLYWMAEKLTWGYEGVEKDPAEAFRLYKQAADLGFSDALIRLGQLQEHGNGLERDPNAALRSYEAAAKAGNFLALAFLAKLLSRTQHLEKADALWNRFFVALEADPEPAFLAASRGELLHNYITTQLRLGLDPGHRDMLQRHRLDIVAHHQQLLEHTSDQHLGRLEGVADWVTSNLGPWPVQQSG